MTRQCSRPAAWKLCRGKTGCSKASLDNEMLHQEQWTVKKKAA